MNTPPSKWSLEFTERANKDFKKLDANTYRKINTFIEKNLLQTSNPRALGKPLSGNLKEFWRYRVGDYRLICEIVDHKMIIIMMKIDHRKDAYKNVHFLKSSS